MRIEYATSLAARPHLVDGFFESWPVRPTPVVLLRVLQSSDVALVALDADAGGRAVGFATAITDGSLAAFVPLLEVLPPYRGRGIGTELMRRLLRELDHLYAVDVVCDPEVVPFYERLGMEPANAMVVRRPERIARVAATQIAVGWAASSVDVGTVTQPSGDDPADAAPPWLEPRPSALPTPVPVPPLTLHRDEFVVVWASDFEAVDEGFRMAIHVQTAHEARLIEAFGWALRDGRYRRTDMRSPLRELVRSELPPEAFRCGLRFADGTVADSVSDAQEETRSRPPGPVMSRYGGGGGGRRYEQSFWVWPLPPDGPMTVWCEWPDGGVPRSEATVDGGAIRTAIEPGR